MNPEHDEQINAYLSGTMPPEEARRFERLLREDADLEREVRLAREALDAARQWAAAEAPNAQEQAARLKIPHLGWHGRSARESLERDRRPARDSSFNAGRRVRPATEVDLPVAGPSFSNAEGRVRPATEVDLPAAGPSFSNAGRRVRPAFVRFLAAAALFAAGILVGAMLPRETPPGTPRDISPGSSHETVSSGARVTSPALPASATPATEKQVIPPAMPVAPRPALADAGRNAPKEEAAPPARGITPLRVVESGAERLVLESTLVGSGGRATWVVDGSFRLAENKAGGI
jgi:hypothetical protein